MESIQLLNTAIIKNKEKEINQGFEERLKVLCESRAIEAINYAIVKFSDSENISRDQACIEIINTIKELDKVWADYVTVEGINRLKEILKQETKTH